MSEEHFDFIPDKERNEETPQEVTTVNKFENMCYAQIVYSYFSRDVVDLVTQKGMFKIQNNEEEVVDAISIRLSGFEQYGTWLLINSSNIDDMSSASVMPDDEMMQDAVHVRQLEFEQVMTIMAMSGIDKFNAFFKKWSSKE
jgi:hypothetical protein